MSKIRLFLNYYIDLFEERQKELDECLLKNIECNSVDEIHLFVIQEHVDKVPYKSNKIASITIIEERPTFQSMMSFANYYVHSENDISVLFNSDIYFDDTLQLCRQMSNNQVYALTRWDVNTFGKVVFFNRRDSNDTWIFKGTIKTIPDSDYCFGIAGVDNTMAERFERAGYVVKNPSLTIKSYHIHNSNVRHYNPRQGTPKPYLLITPHTLQEKNIIKHTIN